MEIKQRGGKRAGAGRRPGQRSKATEARAVLAETAAAQGITPLEVMLQTMRGAWEMAEQLKGTKAEAEIDALIGYRKLAMNAAIDAAPYVHPRLAAIQQTIEGTFGFADLPEDDRPQVDATARPATGSDRQPLN